MLTVTMSKTRALTLFNTMSTEPFPSLGQSKTICHPPLVSRDKQRMYVFEPVSEHNVRVGYKPDLLTVSEKREQSTRRLCALLGLDPEES